MVRQRSPGVEALPGHFKAALQGVARPRSAPIAAAPRPRARLRDDRARHRFCVGGGDTLGPARARNCGPWQYLLPSGLDPSDAAIRNHINQNAPQHLHGVRDRVRRRLGRHPHRHAPPNGFSDTENDPAGVCRMVARMDVGQHRPSLLSAAEEAQAGGL
jgi:hypothetical protein